MGKTAIIRRAIEREPDRFYRKRTTFGKTVVKPVSADVITYPDGTRKVFTYYHSYGRKYSHLAFVASVLKGLGFEVDF